MLSSVFVHNMSFRAAPPLQFPIDDEARPLYRRLGLGPYWFEPLPDRDAVYLRYAGSGSSSVAESSYEVMEWHRVPELLLPLDNGIRRRALLSSGQCSDGFVADCSGNGQCCDSDWVGDGSADCGQTSTGCDLSCYANDGGDCLVIDSSEDGSMTRSLQDVQSYSYSFSYDSTFGDADLVFGGLVAAHRVYTIPLAANITQEYNQLKVICTTLLRQ